MLQSVLHYGIHFGLPLVVALVFFKSKWKIAYLIMISTMLIDLDHLLATPIFNPNRCSINFHPLHSYYAMAIYVLLLFFKKTRLLGIGLLIHLFADAVDCLMMGY
ncbi:MAG: DUF6122 family protein [Gelidibacter sp.]